MCTPGPYDPDPIKAMIDGAALVSYARPLFMAEAALLPSRLLLLLWRRPVTSDDHAGPTPSAAALATFRTDSTFSAAASVYLERDPEED